MELARLPHRCTKERRPIRLAVLDKPCHLRGGARLQEGDGRISSKLSRRQLLHDASAGLHDRCAIFEFKAGLPRQEIHLGNCRIIRPDRHLHRNDGGIAATCLNVIDRVQRRQLPGPSIASTELVKVFRERLPGALRSLADSLRRGHGQLRKLELELIKLSPRVRRRERHEVQVHLVVTRFDLE